MTITAKSAPPEHLSADSKALWERIAGSRITSPERLALLQIALETLDRLSQVRQVLAKSDLTSVTKRTNVVHLNPLLASETKLRDQFIELWWRLDLQDQPYGK